MLVALSFAWGLTWPAMKIALSDIPPFSMRAASLAVGGIALYALARLQGHSLRIKNRAVWVHVFVIACLNMVAFSVCAAFAQLSATTGRVAMLVYTMPIWASLMARAVLGERFSTAGIFALGLCCVGMAVLIYPLASTGVPAGILLALGAAVSWAAGTVYMKWADVGVDPMALAIWQAAIALVILGACIPIFQGEVHLLDARAAALVGVVLAGLMGSGIAYFLWYNVISLVPAMTASLGVLSAPAVGVLSSVVLLGERPTLSDVVGFALILSASACVLLAPGTPPDVAEPK